MGLCVAVVLDDRARLDRLQEELAAVSPPLRLTAVGAGATPPLEVMDLNPALQRSRRQRRMAVWLLPFGFAAGAMFTFITDLDTFRFAGTLGEPLLGGLLGMGSGWMGSFAAAASVSGDGDDRVRSVRNRLEEGAMVLLVEAPAGATIPWTRLQAARPRAVVRLRED
jgi:hypothetical protein